MTSLSLTPVVWTFALVTATIHAAVFVMEALLIERPAVHAGVFGTPTDEVPAVRLWAFGVGFYNLFIACGLAGGVVAWAAGQESVGRTLVLYLCAFTFLSGLVLYVAELLGFARTPGKQLAGAIGQSGPPLIALVAAAL
ncbi:MAG: DUF1304 domain-containing protein [Nocardioides sp.]